MILFTVSVAALNRGRQIIDLIVFLNIFILKCDFAKSELLSVNFWCTIVERFKILIKCFVN